MTNDRPPAYRPRIRVARERSRNFEWWDDREHAETVQCPRYPRGCGAPIGATCRDRAGTELRNQPAHLARLRLASAAEPSTDQAAPTADEETRT